MPPGITGTNTNVPVNNVQPEPAAEPNPAAEFEDLDKEIAKIPANVDQANGNPLEGASSSSKVKIRPTLEQALQDLRMPKASSSFGATLGRMIMSFVNLFRSGFRNSGAVLDTNAKLAALRRKNPARAHRERSRIAGTERMRPAQLPQGIKSKPLFRILFGISVVSSLNQ